MSFREPALHNTDNIIDDRLFIFGQVWKIRDALIAIPDADRVGNRNEHFSRCVVVVDNNQKNSSEDYPIITICPLSHRTDCIRDFDVELSKENDQVIEDCLARLSLSQPVLKKDLFTCEGEISPNAKTEILAVLMQKFGLIADEVDELEAEEELEETGTE